MNVHSFRAAWLGIAVLTLASAPLSAENWPQWRGPHFDGHSRERSLPMVWSRERGITWTAALPAWGTSSPVVWNRSVFVTSHTQDGQLLLLHIGAQTGTPIWTRQVGTGTTPRDGPQRGRQHFHRLHNLATPSPVTNGEVVVAHFGNGDLAAYDFNGGQLWKRNLQQDYGSYTIWWGHANSPVIFEDLVISVCMQDSLADLQDEPTESYLVAHDLRTGKTRWKTARMTGAQAEECDAYTTPIVTFVRQEPRLIIMGGNQLDCYDPRTGKQIWYLPDQTGGRTVTSPTILDNMVFATRGKQGALLAAPLDGRGELGRRDILWTNDVGTPDSCTPLAHRTLVFTISDRGIARCMDIESGKLQWKERLPGEYKASPVWYEGRLLLLNTEGTCTIIAAARRFMKLYENRLQDQTIASPAIANGHIYLRGHKYLYCIGRSFR
jgi:outer membrane protein assembly factor BamB